MGPTEQRTGRTAILLMLLCALCLCGGQFIWKCFHGPFAVLAGFAVYGTGGMAMLCAYRRGSLSVLQPLGSVSYALAMVLGAVFFREAITARKVLGVTAIMAGVFLLAGEEK